MMKPSSRRGGLAAVVLGSAIGVGSMSGCGAAILGGAAYLAAEEVAQSNVEAAKIRARALAATRGYENYTPPANDPSLYERISSDYLERSRFFACNSFQDSNRNGFLEVQEIRGGPRDTFRTDEQIYLAGWDLSEKRLDFTIYDSSGKKLAQRNFPGHRGGHGVIYQPFSLPAGTYTVLWERDENGAGQRVECARQKIKIIDAN